MDDNEDLGVKEQITLVALQWAIPYLSCALPVAGAVLFGMRGFLGFTGISLLLYGMVVVWAGVE